jgi:hypothetical protein
VKSDASTSSNYFNNESPCASKVRPPTHILPKLAVYRLNHDEISVDEVFDAIENGLYVCDNIKKPAVNSLL